MEDLDQKEIEMRTKHFSSWDWRFGRKIDFQYEISKRFSWGQMNIQFQVDKGKISDVNVYSDSLKPMTIEKLPKYLKGIRYHKKNICSELRLYWAEDKQEEEMIADIIDVDKRGRTLAEKMSFRIQFKCYIQLNKVER